MDLNDATPQQPESSSDQTDPTTMPADQTSASDCPTSPDLNPRLEADKQAIYERIVKTVAGSIEGFVHKATVFKRALPSSGPDSPLVDATSALGRYMRLVEPLGGPAHEPDERNVTCAEDPAQVMNELLSGNIQLRLECSTPGTSRCFPNEAARAFLSTDYRFRESADSSMPAIDQTQRLEVYLDAQSMPTEIREAIELLLDYDVEYLVHDRGMDLSNGLVILQFFQTSVMTPEALLALANETSSTELSRYPYGKGDVNEPVLEPTMPVPCHMDDSSVRLIMSYGPKDVVPREIQFWDSREHEIFVMFDRHIERNELGALERLVDGSRSLEGLVADMRARATTIYDGSFLDSPDRDNGDDA